MAHVLDVQPTSPNRNWTAAVLIVWFALALGGSLTGVFASESRPPLLLGLAAVIPVVVFVLGYLASSRFRQYVATWNLKWLTLAQSWRVAGIVFVILYYQGALPGVFALPAGLGDLAIGLTAPLVVWSWKALFPSRAFVVWNLLGILDLVTAVSLGVLASQSSLGVLAEDVTTRLMGQFPLSLIPTFFVPFFLILHLIVLIRVRQESKTGLD